MLLVFLAGFACAAFGAAVAYILSRNFGIQARWLVPAMAGGAMLLFTIWHDYSWFARQRDGLPEGVVVLETYPYRGPLQPWTYLFPVVNRYTALDTRSLARHDARPEVVYAPLFIAQRFQPTFVSAQLIDCADGRRADAVDAGEDGLPPQEAWFPLPEDHPILAAVCQDRAGRS